jgi:hypothetical protein
VGISSLLGTGYKATDELMALNAEFENLRAANANRVGRMNQYRMENNTVRDSRNDLDVFDLNDYGRRPKGTVDQARRHNIPIPLGKAVTVKHAYRIAGAPFDMTVDQREDTIEESHRSDTMEKVAWGTYKHSKGQTAFASAAWDGSELGSSVFDVWFSPVTNLPCFRRIDPVGFFEVQGVEDPHDFERVYRVWSAPLASVRAQYREKLYDGQPVSINSMRMTTSDNGVDMVDIVQMCDKNRVVRWVSGADENSVVPVFGHQHDYGFAPYVIIPNIGPYEDVWGWADYEFVRSLVAYIPQLLAREADVLKAVANGGMIERGTGAAPQTVKRVISEGGILPSKREGTVDPIAAPDMPAFHGDHSARAVDLFKMVGFAPDAAWGLPGSGSGTDRGLQLQPLLEYTGMKQMNWSAGISRLMSYVFRIVEAKTTEKVSYSGTIPGKHVNQSQPFRFLFGPDAAAKMADETDSLGMPTPVELPMTPKDVFDGEYEISVKWRNRIDPDDPQYLQTTLENLGVAAPEEEMKRIEEEADRFPWINQGQVALITAQMGQTQGQGGGNPGDTGGQATQDAMGSMLSPTGASGSLNADAATAASGGTGTPYGGA